MMIDLHKLEIFMRVAESGSFSRAADGLLMTQSAVSQHIRDLEASLGATLFDRGPRGAKLTHSGETLYGYAERIFNLLTEAENAVTDIEKLLSGKIVIGATPGVSIYLLPEWIPPFRAKYPNLSITLRTGTSSDILTSINQSQMDFGIIEGELDESVHSWLVVEPLQKVEQMVVVGPQHPWWARQTIPIDALNDQSMITRQPHSHTSKWLNHALEQLDVKPKVNGEFDNIESIKHSVMLGSHLAILPSYVVQQEQAQNTLHAIEIQQKPLTRVTKLIYRKRRSFSPVVKAFLTYLRTRFPIEVITHTENGSTK